MLYFIKGFRSINTENLGSFGQRASKLPAVKVGGHKKKSADRPLPLLNQHSGAEGATKYFSILEFFGFRGHLEV